MISDRRSVRYFGMDSPNTVYLNEAPFIRARKGIFENAGPPDLDRDCEGVFRMRDVLGGSNNPPGAYDWKNSPPITF